MELSPFPYQGPLSPELVSGRDALLVDLTERVTERRVTTLLGPRRYGKTSVLRRLAADLTEVTTVWVDLYEVVSVADVAVRFDEGLSETRGPFGALAREVAVRLSLNLGALKVQLIGPARNRPDPVVTLHSLLEVLVRAAEKTSVLLVVDEFWFIAGVPGAAGALRTAAQHHYQDIGMIFAGSQPSMMRALFSGRAEPFYGQADLVDIGPLSPGAIEEIVTAGFASTQRDAGGLGGLLASFARGHPQRTMQLADACWRRTPPGERGDDHWAEGLGDVRAASAQGLEALFSEFNAGERSVLRAVAQSGTVYGAEADLLELSKGTATHARRSLVNKGDLVETDEGIQLVDPVLADWIRHRFLL
ncbi:MAG TPA: hypothetical protein VEJ84_05225 [Acidimicrobiales bacterium]|nr:hypothetical protein [Acidimicrobiales bacterium]